MGPGGQPRLPSPLKAPGATRATLARMGAGQPAPLAHVLVPDCPDSRASPPILPHSRILRASRVYPAARCGQALAGIAQRAQGRRPALLAEAAELLSPIAAQDAADGCRRSGLLHGIHLTRASVTAGDTDAAHWAAGCPLQVLAWGAFGRWAGGV